MGPGWCRFVPSLPARACRGRGAGAPGEAAREEPGPCRQRAWARRCLRHSPDGGLSLGHVSLPRPSPRVTRFRAPRVGTEPGPLCPGDPPSVWLAAVVCAVLAVACALCALQCLRRLIRYVFFPGRTPPSAIDQVGGSSPPSRRQRVPYHRGACVSPTAHECSRCSGHSAGPPGSGQPRNRLCVGALQRRVRRVRSPVFSWRFCPESPRSPERPAAALGAGAGPRAPEDSARASRWPPRGQDRRGKPRVREAHARTCRAGCPSRGAPHACPTRSRELGPWGCRDGEESRVTGVRPHM